ncbi:MAG: hypothetical protein HY351_02995, partial [Candidatus Omnitrophica bacterium]|nr:hypothetical protein [Candidatus Omnitrophota bacterium]
RARRMRPDDEPRKIIFYERALQPSYDVYAKRTGRLVDYEIDLTREFFELIPRARAEMRPVAAKLKAVDLSQLKYRLTIKNEKGKREVFEAELREAIQSIETQAEEVKRSELRTLITGRTQDEFRVVTAGLENKLTAQIDELMRGLGVSEFRSTFEQKSLYIVELPRGVRTTEVRSDLESLLHQLPQHVQVAVFGHVAAMTGLTDERLHVYKTRTELQDAQELVSFNLKSPNRIQIVADSSIFGPTLYDAYKSVLGSAAKLAQVEGRVVEFSEQGKVQGGRRLIITLTDLAESFQLEAKTREALVRAA